MDRPRRALIEDADEEQTEVGSQPARRSGGYVPADGSTNVPAPRGRRSRIAEPVDPEDEPDDEPDDEPPAESTARPRRAFPTAEPTPSPDASTSAASDAADPDDDPPTVIRPLQSAVWSSDRPRTPSPTTAPKPQPKRRPRVHHEIAPVVVERLIKSYRGTVAVHDLNFTVEPGRITAFLGPNGSGKTTTLRILVGLVAPTAGSARFGQVAYADLDDPQRRVGAVLEANFHPHRTGRNHLRVLAPTAGVTDARVDAVLELVDLTSVARRPTGQYSLGMRQRLALAAALLGDPDYLILDEPANGLDPEGIRWLRSFLRDYADSGRLVFLSSHQLAEVQAVADDIVVIDKGRLLTKLAMSDLRLGSGSIRVRVSDSERARSALAGFADAIEVGSDDRGRFLRVHSHEVAAVGTALFRAGIVVHELHTESRDLEHEFFTMLERSS